MTHFPNRGRCTHCFSLFGTFGCMCYLKKLINIFSSRVDIGRFTLGGTFYLERPHHWTIEHVSKSTCWLGAKKLLFDKTFFAGEVGIRQFVCQDVSCDKTSQLVLVESQWILVSICSFPKMGATWLVDFMENPIWTNGWWLGVASWRNGSFRIFLTCPHPAEAQASLQDDGASFHGTLQPEMVVSSKIVSCFVAGRYVEFFTHREIFALLSIWLFFWLFGFFWRVVKIWDLSTPEAKIGFWSDPRRQSKAEVLSTQEIYQVPTCFFRVFLVGLSK